VVFKTTAIDHSAIPPAFASVHHRACFGVARQSAEGATGGRVEFRPELAHLCENQNARRHVSPEV
jgi:hypothetical protein